MVTLNYNGKKYELVPGDIPGISGDGTIMIKSTPTNQYSDIRGIDGKISSMQVNGMTFINNVNIETLVGKLEARANSK